MGEHDWKEARTCPECEADVSPDNWEFDGDYIRLDCQNCSETSFQNNIWSEYSPNRRRSGENVFASEDTSVSENNSPSEKDLAVVEAAIDGDVSIHIQDNLTEEGECARPDCESDAERQAKSNKTGRYTGKLCEEHYQDAIEKDRYSPIEDDE